MTSGRAGSIPVLGTKNFDLVAQLVEHLPFKERVLGSSPSQVTLHRPHRLGSSVGRASPF